MTGTPLPEPRVVMERIRHWRLVTVWPPVGGPISSPRRMPWFAGRPVTCLALSTSGRATWGRADEPGATPSQDVVEVWEVAARRKIGMLSRAAAVAISPDGFLIARSAAGLQVVRGRTGRELYMQPGEPAAMAFSPDGTKLGVAWRDGRLQVLAATSGGVVWTAAEGAVALAFTAGGELLAGTEAGRVLLHDALTGEVRLHADAGDERVTALAASGGRVVAGGAALTVWQGRAVEALLIGHALPAVGAGLFVDRVVSASEDGTVRAWDPTTGAEVDRLDLRHIGDRPTCIAVTPRRALVGTALGWVLELVAV